MDSDISEAEGMLRKTGAGTYAAIKTNLNAVTAPGVNDDSSAGYGLFSVWLDVTGDKIYFCLDASVGAAVWQEVGSGGGGGGLTASVQTGVYTITGSEDVGVDSSGGSFDVTLKASPNTGDVAIIRDVAQSCTEYPVGILRNGSTINGLAEDASLNINSGVFWFIYDGTTWLFTPIFNSVGGGGLTASVKDAAYTLTGSEDVGVDSLSIGAFNITLKANPVPGDVAIIRDVKQNCGTTAVGILRNGATINGVAEDANLDVDNAIFWFTCKVAGDWLFTPILTSTGGGLTPVFIDDTDSPYAASSGELVLVDSTVAVVTVNLPITPSDKNRVAVFDRAGSAGTNAITVGRNGETINGAAEDFTIDQNFGGFDGLLQM
jgi:hypothetical protein